MNELWQPNAKEPTPFEKAVAAAARYAVVESDQIAMFTWGDDGACVYQLPNGTARISLTAQVHGPQKWRHRNAVAYRVTGHAIEGRTAFRVDGYAILDPETRIFYKCQCNLTNAGQV
jgi:hypothetical protein